MPKGWKTPEAGYWLNEPAGREVLAGWRADAEAVKIYKTALEDAQKRVEEAHKEIDELTARAKAQARRWPIGLGVFGGVDHHGDAVVGVGVVVLVK